MGQYTSYYLYQKYEKIGQQEPTPVYPSVFSVDGEGTMPVSAKTENDPECGYVPPVVEQYRWVNLPIGTDYICDECNNAIYAWNKAPVSNYVCDSTTHTKYYKEYYQVSYDNGVTWQNVTPESSRTSSDVIEYDSEDCGYTPTPFSGKFRASYSAGTTYSAACDGNTVLTTATTRPSGYNFSSTTSADIGNCVTKIDDFALYKFLSLTKLNSDVDGIANIPSGITEIGYNAFEYCVLIRNINIPYGVSEIKSDTFRYCDSMTSCTIPNSVTSIGQSAFYECKSLININIPNRVTSIEDYTFYYCSRATGATIGSSVTSIGESAFENCLSLKSIVIPNSVTSIGDAAFLRCNSLTSITIGSGVTYIGKSAFATGSKLITNLVIPNSVITIDDSAFSNSSGLTSLTIGNSVTRIGRSAFEGCIFLKNIVIPSSVTTIGSYAFKDCYKLESITILATTPPDLEYNYYPFYNTNNCPIYVPAASVNSYKTGNWNKYADRIQAIT